MPIVLYTEPDTNFRYERSLSKDEANDVSTANPMVAQRIQLPDTGGTIDFDGNGGALIVSASGKKSSANAGEFVKAAKNALSDGDDL